MNIKTILYFSFFVFVFPPTMDAAQVINANNLLQNGDFTNELEGWSIVSWGNSPEIVDNTLKIILSGTGNTHFAFGQNVAS